MSPSFKSVTSNDKMSPTEIVLSSSLSKWDANVFVRVGLRFWTKPVVSTAFFGSGVWSEVTVASLVISPASLSA